MALFNWPWRTVDSSNTIESIDTKEEGAFNFSDNKTSMSLVNKKSIQNFIVKAVGYVTAQTQRRELFTRPEFNLAEIRDASEADSYVKISLSKYSYLIYKAGWKFKSENQNAIDYLEQRFKIMSYCTGVPMDILMQGIADDLVRYSNAFLLKSRVDRIPGVKAQAITQDGQIVADMITTGTMSAERIVGLKDVLLNEYGAYIHINEDDGSVEFGQTDAQYKLVVDNDGVTIYQGTTPISYWEQNAFTVEQLNLGNFAFIPRQNGSLGFRKVR